MLGFCKRSSASLLISDTYFSVEYSNREKSVWGLPQVPLLSSDFIKFSSSIL